VVDSVLRQRGRTITIMFARQMGKNETSAQIEAYLLTLYAGRGGTIVKAAPSFKPQIITSMLRLRRILDRGPLTRGRWRPSFGYMISLGAATTSFLSADSRANVVGATASLLLEIDEAQDVDPDKYDRELRPMASSTNATTVLYGTAWSEDNILQRQKLLNLAHEKDTGERLHFEYDWTHLGAISPAYHAFVTGEIGRLGKHHPSIRTQYLLHCLEDAGRLFSSEQRRRLRGSHDRLRAPDPDRQYVAGIDIAGEDENAEDAVARALVPKRDSTVITIAELGRDANGNGTATVVDHVWWTGRDLQRQYDDLLRLWAHWRFARVVVDASGIGAAFASFLASRFGERVEELVFSAPAKSKLAYDTLAMINTGRVAVYRDDHSPESGQLWREVHACRYWLRANDTLAWGVPPAECHDDFVISLALCCRAADTSFLPVASGLVRTKPPADEISIW
jgi:hypothetical protein